MRSLWEPRARRGECGKFAVRGVLLGMVLALAAIAAVGLRMG